MAADPQIRDARLIWEIPEPEPRQRRAPLTRERIAAAGVAIADAEGPEAVSMRRVAAELGAGTMSLYHYIRGKDDLLALMFDRVGAEMLVAGELPDGWRDALRAISHRTRDTFRAHPWLLGTLGRPRPTPNGVRHIEQTIAAVSRLDVEPPELRGTIALAADDFTLGYVLRERLLRQRWATGGAEDPLDEPASRAFLERMLATENLPNLAAAREHMRASPGPAPWTSDRFEQGLEWLLDGIEAMVARQRARGRRPTSRRDRPGPQRPPGTR
jgi:AcrR family transcriptional regulator